MPERNSSPLPHGRVLVGYDGSGPALRALDRAVDEAVRRGTALEILCGAPWAPPPTPGTGLAPAEQEQFHRIARLALDDAAERAARHAPELRIVPTLTDEPAAAALLHAARTAGLVVVGTRGHGGFAGLLLGSVSLRVAAHSAAPVMVVRGDAELDEKPRGALLVGVKSDADAPAVRFALQEAARRDARVRALHAWLHPAPPGGMPTVDAERMWLQAEQRREAEETVARDAVAALRAEFPDIDVAADHELAPPAAAVLEATAAVDLVILAARRDKRRYGLQLGPVTHAVLHHARCPVVLVPVV
ncbi:universal stress protein [Streptomyces sp. NPDC051940]|uniref:universal stress protein n=1 Tax=Streptomyces sp. NPDC051940 TaxID=3155675 RepID=UPI003447CF12